MCCAFAKVAVAVSNARHVGCLPAQCLAARLPLCLLLPVCVPACLPEGRLPASLAAGRCGTPNSTPHVTPQGAEGGPARLQAGRLAAALAGIAAAEGAEQAAEDAFAFAAAAAAGVGVGAVGERAAAPAGEVVVGLQNLPAVTAARCVLACCQPWTHCPGRGLGPLQCGSRVVSTGATWLLCPQQTTLAHTVLDVVLTVLIVADCSPACRCGDGDTCAPTSQATAVPAGSNGRQEVGQGEGGLHFSMGSQQPH